MYKPKCGSNFYMQVFFTKEYKIINFIGNRPNNCFCNSINDQTNALILNKDKSPSQIFLQNSNLFKDCQEISNLKHKLSDSYNIKKFSNIADELQYIENELINKDNFVKHVHKFEKYDNNGVCTDLPIIICYDRLILSEMLNSALKSPLVLHFDKTYNLSIYHISTISYKSNSILSRKTGAPALMLGIFLLHKSSSKTVFSYFFNHFKTSMLSLMKERNITYEFSDIFSICTDQEKGITSAIKETFNNIDIFLCKKHITDNLPHNIKCIELIKLLKGLTACKNEDEFFAKKNVILDSDSFSDCDANQKRYVCSIIPLILNHIVKPLNKFCKCEATLHCVCKPLTNNLAESANHKIKQFCRFEKGTPTELIEKLKGLNDLQLTYISLMFNDRGNFLCPELSLPFTIEDKELLETLFNRFFNDELLDEVVQPSAKRQRLFKTKLGSTVVCINNKHYIKSSDGKKLYPLGLTATAHKPYNGPKKTRSYPKVSN